MGGGDLNAKKAWHPNTLKNQERVWKAEQAAAEEKKRIAELEREKHLERERAELNKLVKSSLAPGGLPDNDRLHWMYEKPDKKVQQEEYLLGKAIDKNHQQAGKSEADEIPAVSRRVVGSSLLTVSGDTQVDLARKMREDPLLLVKERERAARAALLNNPVQRAKLTELLRKEQMTKKETKSKKKKKSTDLDNILAEKLQALSGSKGIDLASLLASDDSSSDSSDEKSKKKKKKKKKSKSKNRKSEDSDSDKLRRKTKYDGNPENKKVSKQKRDSSESNSDYATRKRCHPIENESDRSQRDNKHRYNKDSSEDDRLSVDNDAGKQKHNSKYSSKDKQNKYRSSDASSRDTKTNNVVDKKKRRHNSVDRDKANKGTFKKHCRDSSEYDSDEDKKSGHGEINKKREYVREERYWNYTPHSSKFQSKDDKYALYKDYSKKGAHSENHQNKYEHESNQRNADSNRDSKKTQDDRNSKYERSRGRSESNFTALDKGRPMNKRSGLSEAEKASKLAEMVAAGAEREKQRERRVADQLAEKEAEDRPGTHLPSRNIIRQLPDSLESRIHSNRHYIQRDQKHMNENFAKR